MGDDLGRRHRFADRGPPPAASRRRPAYRRRIRCRRGLRSRMGLFVDVCPVVSLDPRWVEVLAPIGVGVEPSAIAVGAGAVWVANRADGTITRIDPERPRSWRRSASDARPRASRRDRRPCGSRTAVTELWSRIDPSDGAINATVPVVNPPRGVALTPEKVYLAVQSTGVEHRGGTLRVLTSTPRPRWTRRLRRSKQPRS